jgi:hypothetical protein
MCNFYELPFECLLEPTEAGEYLARQMGRRDPITAEQMCEYHLAGVIPAASTDPHLLFSKVELYQIAQCDMFEYDHEQIEAKLNALRQKSRTECGGS